MHATNEHSLSLVQKTDQWMDEKLGATEFHSRGLKIHLKGS